MTAAEVLEKLELLDREATPGPWKWDRALKNRDYIAQGSYLGETLITLGDTYENSGADCLLLETLRNALPAILEALRAGQKLRGTADSEGCDEQVSEWDSALARIGEALG